MEIARDFSACAQECFYGVLMGRVYFYDVTFCKERIYHEILQGHT